MKTKTKTKQVNYVSFRRITSVAEETLFEKASLCNAEDAAIYARQFYHEDLTLYESFFIIMLDRQNKSTAYAKISQGGVSGTVVDPKIICKLAVDTLCSGVILVHNHPSGNTTPSGPDKDVTAKIKTALSYLDISVVDHIILTEYAHYSFANNGIL